jgi:hypothetical protein
MSPFPRRKSELKLRPKKRLRLSSLLRTTRLPLPKSEIQTPSSSEEFEILER